LAIALATDIPPVELRPKVWTRLEYEIKVKRNGHFWGGITAGAYLFHFLLDAGRHDLINLMVSKEDYPGWINMIRNGSGTFFEDWRCSGTALHSSYLYVGSWFIEGLAGIQRPNIDSNHFIINPWINPNGPAEVKAHYNSIYGRIASHWKRGDNTIEMQITIPPNATATVKIIETTIELDAGNHSFSILLNKNN
jgi:alpha-L-rhamnosidase